MIVLPETVAVVGGRKSEYLTFGVEQPVSNPAMVRKIIVINRFIRVVGLTKKVRHPVPVTQTSP